MNDYIDVIETKKIKKCCATCLYFSKVGLVPHCENANNSHENKSKVIVSHNSQWCGWYWLDNSRFQKRR